MRIICYIYCYENQVQALIVELKELSFFTGDKGDLGLLIFDGSAEDISPHSCLSGAKLTTNAMSQSLVTVCTSPNDLGARPFNRAPGIAILFLPYTLAQNTTNPLLQLILIINF